MSSWLSRCAEVSSDRLLWSDEFESNDLDISKWGYEVHAPGQFNNELQRYVGPDRGTVTVEDGKLVITARRDNNEIISSRLVTRGLFDFTFGILELRAKLPYARAMWPAFWLLGSNEPTVGWPTCGEIDIVELFGTRRGQQVCAVTHMADHHYSAVGIGAPLESGCQALPDLAAAPVFHQSFANLSGFHTWRLVWTPDRVAILLDPDSNTEPIFTYLRPVVHSNTNWPFK
jgi:beta-glucanase (GH16 family)